MNNKQRILAILNTILDAAQVGAVKTRMDDDIWYGDLRDSLMERINHLSDDELGLYLGLIDISKSTNQENTQCD